MHNKFKQHWFCSYSLVTAQLYLSNILGLVKIKEQKHKSLFYHQIQPKRKPCKQVLPSNEVEKPLNWKRGNRYTLIIQEIY